jgi:hypothetical protein
MAILVATTKIDLPFLNRPFYSEEKEIRKARPNGQFGSKLLADRCANSQKVDHFMVSKISYTS